MLLTYLLTYLIKQAGRRRIMRAALSAIYHYDVIRPRDVISHNDHDSTQHRRFPTRPQYKLVKFVFRLIFMTTSLTLGSTISQCGPYCQTT